ncbi:MAG: hypothetical protein J0H68_04230 [Sphingobacteriia bacterium]|nr:hypothetical protein [Sphingobacteriia bacterium]
MTGINGSTEKKEDKGSNDLGNAFSPLEVVRHNHIYQNPLDAGLTRGFNNVTAHLETPTDSSQESEEEFPAAPPMTVSEFNKHEGKATLSNTNKVEEKKEVKEEELKEKPAALVKPETTKEKIPLADLFKAHLVNRKQQLDGSTLSNGSSLFNSVIASLQIKEDKNISKIQELLDVNKDFKEEDISALITSIKEIEKFDLERSASSLNPEQFTYSEGNQLLASSEGLNKSKNSRSKRGRPESFFDSVIGKSLEEIQTLPITDITYINQSATSTDVIIEISEKDPASIIVTNPLFLNDKPDTIINIPTETVKPSLSIPSPISPSPQKYKPDVIINIPSDDTPESSPRNTDAQQPANGDRNSIKERARTLEALLYKPTENSQPSAPMQPIKKDAYNPTPGNPDESKNWSLASKLFFGLALTTFAIAAYYFGAKRFSKDPLKLLPSFDKAKDYTYETCNSLSRIEYRKNAVELANRVKNKVVQVLGN